MLEVGYNNITIVDDSYDNILKGLDRINFSKDDIIIKKSFKEIDEVQDLVILSTSSEPRFDIMKALVKNGTPLFLIEKVIFQSIDQFNEMNFILHKNSSVAYCNFPNRYFDNYINLKSKYSDSRKKYSITAGDIGMACSGIHYLDLFEYISQNSILNSSSLLTKSNKKNKRGNNYIDFEGAFFAENSKGDTLEIFFDKSHEGPPFISVEIDNNKFIFSESDESYFYFDSGQISRGNHKIVPSSKLTSKIISDIFHGKTLLPRINDSKNIHLHLFKELA